jgi:hypothetical protein
MTPDEFSVHYHYLMFKDAYRPTPRELNHDEPVEMIPPKREGKGDDTQSGVK